MQDIRNNVDMMNPMVDAENIPEANVAQSMNSEVFS
jgi:hypothetical protein